MKEYRLLKYYPSLPITWKTNKFPITVVEVFNEYALHPSLKGMAEFGNVNKNEVEKNEEYWKEITPKKVILVTEDNVGLHQGDTYYVPQKGDKNTFRGEVLEFTLEVEGDYSENILRFASRENAKDYINKYKNYTTVDGEGIRKGDKFYIYDSKFHKLLYGEFGHFTDKKYDGKRYRTQKEVEDLVELNKVQYSLKDIIRAVNKISFKLYSKEEVLNLLAAKP